MTNKIIELNQKEIEKISGGMSEEFFRYVVEPAITLVCFGFVYIVAHTKKVAEMEKAKLKTQ